MPLEDDLRNITTALSQEQAKRTRAEIELENATASRAKAQEELKTFGVATIEDARNKVIELETAFAAEVTKIETALVNS